MRWKYFAISLLCAFIAGLSLYAFLPTFKNENAELAIKADLKLATQNFSKLAENRLQEIDASLALLISQWNEKNKNLPNNALPVAIYFKKAVLQKAGSSIDQDLFATLSQHAEKEKKLALWKGLSEQYLLWQGSQNGEPYAAAIKVQDVFNFPALGAIKPWLALNDGTIVYHSDTNNIGMDFSNTRPIALANDENNLANYQSFEGKQVLGTWATIPKWNIIIASEWELPWWGKAQSYTLMYFILGLLFIAGFIFAKSLQRHSPQAVIEKPSLDDPEAKEYIKKAVHSAKSALHYAGELEQHSQQMQQLLTQTQWTLETLENFWEYAQELSDGDAVLEYLAQTLSKLTLDSTVLVFRYSAISCSLLPVKLACSDEIPLTTRQVLQEERIYIGNPQANQQLQQSTAWEKWLNRIQAHLVMNSFDFYSLPFPAKSSLHGNVVLLIAKDIDHDQVISQQMPLWEKMLNRAAWLYDIKQRLLQYQHASKKTLANSKNLARSQPTAT